jgi:predicted TIM-barrel fold metal-dependent hydrolase
MIVDCHCHAGTGDGFRGAWDTEARIEPHLARARAAGIQKTVVLPVFNSDYAAANARLARIVRAHPRELIGFAMLNPRTDAGRVAGMIGRAVEQYGFRGIKIHGLDAFPTREVCEAARRYRLPLLVDVVRRVGAVEMLATQYSDVNFIIPHLGGFTDDWMTHLAVIDQLCRFPNVYADSSGVRYWELLREAVRRAGPHKLLFGSDGPLLHPAVELYKIKLLGLSPAQQALITGGNILRLLSPVSGSSPHQLAPARSHLERQAIRAQPLTLQLHPMPIPLRRSH